MARGANTFLGPFEIDREGRLQPSDADRVPRFTVRWRQRPVRVVLRGGGGREGVMQFAAHLGRVPSTAGRSPEQSRDTALRSIVAMTRLMPDDLRLVLAADHSVLMAADWPISLPASVFTVIAEVTRFLLSLGPYLDVLDADGIGFAGGTAKT